MSKIPHWFYVDGCTCYPDGDRLDACSRHDFNYWLGGTKIDKEDADQELFMAVSNLDGFLNKYFHCWVMYLGVKTWGQKPFQEREVKLDECNRRIKRIYIKERQDAYLKQINTTCKR